MRVLVYQQLHAGHCYHYLRYLLPELLQITSDVKVAVTAEGLASVEFSTLLLPFVGRVEFEPILPSGHDRVMKHQVWKLHTDLRSAVKRLKPDYVLVPSGDPHIDMMGVFRMSGVGGLPHGVPGEVGIHAGRGVAAANWKQRLKDRIEALKLATAGWSQVHLVNVLFYEWIQSHGGVLARNCSLLPHPIQPNEKQQLESRRLLGLPERGRLLGVAGVIDYRKAISRLIAAFRAASSDPSERLFIAGAVEQKQRRILDACTDLIDAGRLIVLDTFLDPDAYQTVLSAMDVVCTPYPGFTDLSSVLLEGLAAGRPILTNNLGWCGMTVKRFRAGWACDVSDPAAFTNAIRTAFAECETYHPTEATSRLLAFHAPENFASSYLQRLRASADLPPSRSVTPWSWVLEAL